MSEQKLSIQQVASALEASGGIITAAAHVLGVHRATIHRYINRYPELKEAKQEEAEKTKDLAEGHVLKAIKAGDMHTVRWYLDRLGRDRGYGHRAEVSGLEGGPIQMQDATLDTSKLSTKALREIRNAAIAEAAAEQDAADGQ